jgi:hypothetical protein
MFVVSPICRKPNAGGRLRQAAGRPRWPGYASRRLSTQNVTPSKTTASTTKMPVSMPWKAQNPVTALAAARIRRREVLGGLIHQYEQAA